MELRSLVMELMLLVMELMSLVMELILPVRGLGLGGDATITIYLIICLLVRGPLRSLVREPMKLVREPNVGGDAATLNDMKKLFCENKFVISAMTLNLQELAGSFWNKNILYFDDGKLIKNRKCIAEHEFNSPMQLDFIEKSFNKENLNFNFVNINVNKHMTVEPRKNGIKILQCECACFFHCECICVAKVILLQKIEQNFCSMQIVCNCHKFVKLVKVFWNQWSHMHFKTITPTRNKSPPKIIKGEAGLGSDYG